MAEDFADDFIDEEEGGSRRPFWVLAGLLSFLLVATIACILIYVFVLSDRNGQPDQRVAEIVLTNEAIATANAFVTQTVAAQQTEAARPTDPPTATPTPPPPTPTTPPTPAPTETPVVQPPEDENGDDNDLDEDEAEEIAPQPTPIFPGAGVATATPVPGTTALPDTGLELWMIPLAVFGLLLVLLAARRLRMAG
jgi:outer membrane biosynthesis protein TonB